MRTRGQGAGGKEASILQTAVTYRVIEGTGQMGWDKGQISLTVCTSFCSSEFETMHNYETKLN